jgi:hypothetical protein
MTFEKDSDGSSSIARIDRYTRDRRRSAMRSSGKTIPHDERQATRTGGTLADFEARTGALQ